MAETETWCRQATRVLFICTGNAGRSQIAERLFRQLAGERAVVPGAGKEHIHDP